MPETQPPLAAALLVMSKRKLPPVQCKFSSIAVPFAPTVSAEVQRSCRVEPSGIVIVPVPVHCPDNPRNGPLGPVPAYPWAGASIASAVSTLHRQCAGFKQPFLMSLAFQLALAFPDERTGSIF